MNATFNVIRSLGTGAFGSIVLIQPSWSSDPLAIKILLMDIGEEFDAENTWLRSMRTGDVPHTVHSMGAVLLTKETLPVSLRQFVAPPSDEIDNNYLLIFMPYIAGTTLREYLRIHQYGLIRDVVRDMAAQITRFACQAYHAHKLTHNDLKMGNIMVSPTGHISVIDFTFALRPSHDWNEVTWSRGTLCYMAPEKLFFPGQKPPQYCRQSPCDIACADVWSIGAIMATMALSGKTVFLSRTGTEIIEAQTLSKDKRGFYTEYVDSLYHLLPMQTRPWLSSIADEMMRECPIVIEDIEQIVQPIRLMLWTRALHYRDLNDPGTHTRSVKEFKLFKFDTGRRTYLPPLDSYLPGIGASPLHRLLVKYTPRILEAYDLDGHNTYEHIRDALFGAMGPELFAIYLETQSWKPSARTRCLAALSNPFLNLLEKLQNSPVNFKMVPNEHPDTHVWKRLDEFLNRCAHSPCKCCKGPSEKTGWCAICDTMGVCSGACGRALHKHDCKNK